MSLHRVREGLKEERTACVYCIRGVLAEFGLVLGKSPKVLRAALTDVLEDASNELSTTARLALQRAFDHWRELGAHRQWCDQQVGLHVRNTPAAQRAAKIIGIGEIGASALAGGVGDLKQVMTRDEGFDPQHVSVKPDAKRPLHERSAAASELGKSL